MKQRTLKTLTIVATFLAAACFFSISEAAESSITAWSYYKFPPFVTDDHQGLTYDFVKLLNDYSKDRYHFETTIYPRKRLDAALAQNKKGVVLFVHWSWMKDKDKTKYLWGPKIMDDRNEIVSLADRKIIFDGTAASLKGLKFGTILGRRYKGLNEAMEAGDIRRDDSSTEEQNIKKLLAKRVDFITMPASMLKFFILELKLEGQLFISPTPLSKYSRHILVTKGLEKENILLSDFVNSLDSNPEWGLILKKYGFK